MSYYVNLLTYFGPPHSIAEARTIGSADMATGSMVRELFSTALCTSCDSCGWTAINIKAHFKLPNASGVVFLHGDTEILTSDLVKERHGAMSSLWMRLRKAEERSRLGFSFHVRNSAYRTESICKERAAHDTLVKPAPPFTLCNA